MNDLVERLYGIIPPVITPLTEDGSFDRQSAERLYRFHQDAGVHGLFLFGSSGEGPVLGDDVRVAALETAVQTIGGSVPILAGVLAPATDLAIGQARQAQAAGVDALVVCPPFYFRMTQDEVIEHFRAVRRAVDLPIVAYDIPGTTKIKIALPSMLTLAREGTIVGVKDSSGDAVTFRRLEAQRPAGFRLFTGSELLVDSVLLQGADGCVPGLGNVAPEWFVGLYHAWTAGHHDDATSFQRRIVRLFDVFVSQDGTILHSHVIGAMKTAMKLRGVIASNRTCAPFQQMTPEAEEGVRSILAEAELI